VGFFFLQQYCVDLVNVLITRFVYVDIWQLKQQSVQHQGVGVSSHKNGSPIGVLTKLMCL
jgi:hypothetical protein